MIVDFVGLQRRLIRRPACIDPVIHGSVIQQHVGLDLGDVCSWRLCAIKRNARVQLIAEGDCQLIDDAATETEAH